ncbi:MAG: hypothetical protein N3B01_10650, partial [Verrucomicrobiae bacterium]|nr:hypothetical protein [Verrucomicrobiae bacterium]
GGSWSAGDAERVVTPSGGDAGARRGQRRVERIAGQDSGLWPAEFRDALEGYFKALEVGDR